MQNMLAAGLCSVRAQLIMPNHVHGSGRLTSRFLISCDM
jgi:hypothetical protein